MLYCFSKQIKKLIHDKGNFLSKNTVEFVVGGCLKSCFNRKIKESYFNFWYFYHFILNKIPKLGSQK